MPDIQRHQLKRAKPYPPGITVARCDRSSVLGNPLVRDTDLRPLEAWLRYSETPIPVTLSTGKVRLFCPVKARQRLDELATNPPTHLACWCATDDPGCHLNVVLKLIKERQTKLPFEP